jgi:hypothetical protein
MDERERMLEHLQAFVASARKRWRSASSIATCGFCTPLTATPSRARKVLGSGRRLPHP